MRAAAMGAMVAMMGVACSSPAGDADSAASTGTSGPSASTSATGTVGATVEGTGPVDSSGPVSEGSAAESSSSGELPPEPKGEVIFALDVLHEIDIVVDAEYLEALEYDRENRVPCTFTFDGETLTNAGIRQKGGLGSVSSLDGKPGFSVKLNEFEMGQRLDGMEKLLLNNAQEDATFVSEHVGYEMHRRAGFWGTRTAHAVVTLNDHVYGVFVVREPVSEDFLEDMFGDAEGNLYEGFYHPEDQSLGDFVFHPEELDLKDEIEDMRTREDVLALAAAIDTATDEQFEAEVGPLFALDAYVTQLALDSLLGYWDNNAYFLNNYYLYDNPADARLLYLPHGMDQLQYDAFDADSWPMSRLGQRIREIPAMNERFQSEKARLLAEIWNVEEIHARIDQVGTILHATSRTDQAVLDDIASYDGNVQGVKDSFAARL